MPAAEGETGTEGARGETFRIVRWRDTCPEAGIGMMRTEPLPATALDGATRLMASGIEDGSENRVLFEVPGMSLTYVWFKSGYPLPRHTHDGDCLYHVIAGTLRIGTNDLVRGDTFFVGAGTPYIYTPGPAGVEVLEFRAANAFNIEVHAASLAFWSRAVETTAQRRAAWVEEKRPSDL